MKINMFIDAPNLYTSLQKKYDDKAKLSYKAVREYVDGLGTVGVARVYISEMKNEAGMFRRALNAIGYEVVAKRPILVGRSVAGKELITTRGMFDVEMSVAAIVEESDLTIICSNSPQLLPALRWMITRQRVMLLAAGIPDVLRIEGVQNVEIPESMILRT